MTTLAFLAALAAILVFVIALEADSVSSLKLERSAGLLTWLTRGNWPAKIGGLLVIVGVGALLRYALVNIEIAAQWKLASGIVIALALGYASTVVPDGPAKRPVSLAFGGAAFGVAYLTAYSAFALFNYLSNPMGLSLLGMTAVAMAVFAVTRSALSLALLAMVGAFLAPAFAVDDPGPLVVYGYYAGASLLTLMMVVARGWRALIHLSFLFTLGGGVFFAWTSQYYTANHAEVMLPMVLLLSAIHVAMPILEKHAERGVWLERLDIAYALLLPTVAALLAFFIAPTRQSLSIEFMALGVIWGAAGLTLGLMSRPGIALHAVISLALFVLGVMIRFRNLPWELMLLGFTVAALAIVARRDTEPTRLHNVLAGFVVLFGGLHILSANASPVAPTEVFFNGAFVERFVAAVLLIVAGSICRRIKQGMDTLLLAVGILWLFISVGVELIRWNLATLALVAHWFTILVAMSLWIPGRRVRFADNHTALLLTLILATAWWASVGASAAMVLIHLFASTLAVIGIAIRPEVEDIDSFNGRTGAALLAPLVAFLWASQLPLNSNASQTFFGLTVAAGVALAVMIIGRLSPEQRRDWVDAVSDVFLVSFALLLLKGTVLDIVRDSWAIALDVVCFAGLLTVTWIRHWRLRKVGFWVATCMVAGALIVQSFLLRALGPEGNLDITDVLRLKWPTAISLLWAVMGCALTVWSRKVMSRSLWSSGAVLLVAAAAKLLLIDFGSLGQLANILAVIAAGGVFLLVGWLAPIPPAPPEQDSHDSGEDIDFAAARQRNAWSIAIVLFIIVFSSDSTATLARWFTEMRTHTPALNEPNQSAPPEIPERDDAGAETEPREPEPNDFAASTVPPLEARDAALIAEPAVVQVPTTSPGSAMLQTSTSETVESRELSSYTPPTAVDERGVPTYTQFSLPQTRKPAPEPERARGEEGIEQLLRIGLIRKATRSDMEVWLAAKDLDERAVERARLESGRSLYLYRTYVVTGEITFPEGLFGAHAATFIVPRHVPRPRGNPGHSRVLEMP